MENPGMSSPVTSSPEGPDGALWREQAVHRARVICFSGRNSQTFGRWFFHLLGPSYSHVDNVLWDLKIQANP